ncbi:MAG: Hsp20/alpha crystallin family protein [Planctomycetota bacterium]|jgi:HSP20 family molecular chaperone IbpA
MSEATETVSKREKDIPEGVEPTREGRLFIPLADIHETDDAVVLEANLPDVTADRIDVTLERDMLTIRGRVSGHEPEGYSLAYSEYETGDYQRVFSLSVEIDADNIDARLNRGVLTLRLAKIRPAQKQIRVQAD